MRVNRLALYAVLLLALPLLSVLPGASSPDSASAASVTLCGGRRTVSSSGRVWTCTFDDEFGGSALDTRRWSPLTTAVSSWTTADTCYVNRSANLFVANGGLHLVARHERRSETCRVGARAAYSTRHTGGGVTTFGKFDQTYGRFEFRAKFPATRRSGFWGNLWIYPSKMTYGAWPASGEIDIAEHWSGHGDTVHPTLHYRGSGKGDTASCAVANVSTFHTYRLEWLPSSMTFYVDGRACFTRRWPTGLFGGALAPFNKPFYLVLSEGFGDFSDGISPLLPATGPVVVDWVRAYR